MLLTGHITDLITVAKEMRNAPGVDKERLNRTISHLQNAKYASEGLLTGKIDGTQTDGQCICPTGAVDADCPVHGG